MNDQELWEYTIKEMFRMLLWYRATNFKLSPELADPRILECRTWFNEPSDSELGDLFDAWPALAMFDVIKLGYGDCYLNLINRMCPTVFISNLNIYETEPVGPSRWELVPDTIWQCLLEANYEKYKNIYETISILTM